MTIVRLFILCLIISCCKCNDNATSTSTSTTTVTTTSTEASAFQMELEKIDLDKAETKDAQKLEIIKQIRKINADGSYTIGYEAEDGTFKIESRDVLGNVKGTYGYIDENGEIKRVSYTANNATGLKTMPVDAVSAETAQLLKMNRTVSSTTRRPNSSTPRTNVQPIPRRRYTGKEQSSESTTTLVYATSLSTPKPVVLIRPTSGSYGVKTTGDRPEKFIEIDQVSKVAKNAPPPPPPHEEEEKNGNHLRRQTSEQPENFETQQQVIYGQSAGDDNTHIYESGPGDVTVRPLYTTTGQPRVPSAVLAARQRAVQLQNIISKSPSTTTERVYVKPPKRVEQQQATEQPGKDINEGAEDERRVFRERPIPTYRPREYVRYIPSTVVPAADQRQNYRMPAPAPFRAPSDDQYIRESSRAPPRNNYEEIEQNDIDYQRRPYEYQQQSYPVPFQYQRQPNPYEVADRPLTARDFERLLQLLIYRHQQLQQYNRGYPGVNPYYQQPTSPYPPGGYYGYQIPRPPFYNPNPLYDPRYENPSYSPSAPQRQYQQDPPPQRGNEQQQPPPPPLPPYQTPATNDAEQGAYYDSQRTVPRRRMYYPPRNVPPTGQENERGGYQDYENTNQLTSEYLPPNVREDLLYRMFMLALRADPSAPVPAASNIEPTTIQPATSRKPVRSVQILGEEETP